jgi:hypothetical protein
MGPSTTFMVGYGEAINGSAIVENNYLFNNSNTIKSWTNLSLKNNLVSGFFNLVPAVGVDYSNLKIDNNKYYLHHPVLTGVFGGIFSKWQSVGFDLNGSQTDLSRTGMDIIVRPNKYESGRGHIVVYNWDKLNSANVDISSLGLKNGDDIAIYDVQNILGQPVFSGKYSGSPISLPLNLTVRAKYFGDFSNAYHPLRETHTRNPSSPPRLRLRLHTKHIRQMS